MTKHPGTWHYTACALGLVSLLPAASAAADEVTPPNPTPKVPEVVVIGTAPLPGSGVDLDKVPSNVQTMGAAELDPDQHSNSIPIAAARRMTSVNLNNEQGSPFQPDFVYRGFEASPISGIAQGVAVYQNGTRLNEAFGDTVNWDLIPQFALNRLTVQSNNPVFGLNALGGAVTLDMKNAFNSPGGELQVSAGRFNNVTGYGAYAVRSGDFGFYGAVGGVQDHGFRFVSPTNLRQGYVDFGYEDGRATAHLSGTFANNYLGAVGPTPVELLAADHRAVFTYPQSMRNEMQLAQLAGTLKATDTLLLSGNVYHRHYVQHLVDGNTTDVQACDNDPNFFCLEGEGEYPADALFNSRGMQVPTSVLPDGATPGEIDFTSTSTQTTGGALQGTYSARLWNFENNLVVGASIDHSVTDYSAQGELGTLLPTLEVVGSGTIIDQGLSPTASPPIETPVSVRSSTDYYGAYFTDTLSFTRQLAWTISGRFNRADIDIRDQLGTSLNGSHGYSRFNPGTGLTYKVTDAVTAYAGYSEANRAPTAGELTCSDPTSPCLLDAFLVSDPELRQVVSRTYELGLRGRLADLVTSGSSLRWNVSVFRTQNSDDIILLATQINGFGYFANAGATRRQGIEAGIAWRSQRWEANLNYSLVDATFREHLTISSNSPAADENGDIQVQPGNRIPLTPRNRVTLDLEYSPTKQWKIGADARYVSGQFLAGDESNQEPQLPSYTVVNFHTSYQATASLQLFVGLDNVFNTTYYTFGTFTQLDGLPPNFNLTNPRTYSPSPPRTWFAGIKLTL